MYSDFDEDDLEARFVYLPDCNHSIEFNGLDNWVKTIIEEVEMKAITCPKCKTPIRQSDRYLKELNYIQNRYEKIKERYRTLENTGWVINYLNTSSYRHMKKIRF